MMDLPTVTKTNVWRKKVTAEWLRRFRLDVTEAVLRDVFGWEIKVDVHPRVKFVHGDTIWAYRWYNVLSRNTYMFPVRPARPAAPPPAASPPPPCTNSPCTKKGESCARRNTSSGTW